MLPRLAVPAALACVLTLSACGSAQTEKQSALDEALAKTLAQTSSLGTPQSLDTWKAEYTTAKASATPKTVKITGSYSQDACTVLQQNLPVAGGPTGATPVDPEQTLAKAGILSGFANQQKHEPQAQILNAVVNTLIVDWKTHVATHKPLPGQGFGALSTVCEGRELNVLPESTTSPSIAPSASPTTR